ncbi:MAG: hypothetical protein AMXMBFR25_31470 [Lysobacterales bacterium]|nr:hypothetical protein [Xanthomonadales bacterium]
MKLSGFYPKFFLALALIGVLMVFLIRPDPHPSPASPPADAEDIAEAPALAAEEARNSPPSDATTPTPPAQTPAIAIPPGFQFAGIRQVKAASSLDELLADHPETEQAIIRDFINQLDPAAYLFRSPRELEWMVQRGFPMPAEILAASRMSDDELMQMALAGNTKAAFLAIQRNNQRPKAEAYLPGQGFLRQRQINALAAAAESPFIGYLYAQELQRNYPSEPGAGAGGLLLVIARGDGRPTKTFDPRGVHADGMMSSYANILAQEEGMQTVVRSISPCGAAPVFPMSPATQEELRRLRASRNHFPGKR